MSDRKAGGKMSTTTAENVIIRAIHEAFIKYPEGDGGPNLDYRWIQPEQSSHVAKAIILELAANGFEIVKKGP
jgi:hypothetical protein